MNKCTDTLELLKLIDMDRKIILKVILFLPFKICVFSSHIIFIDGIVMIMERIEIYIFFYSHLCYLSLSLDIIIYDIQSITLSLNNACTINQL